MKRDMCITGVIRSSGLTFDVLGSKFRRPRLSDVKPFVVSFAQAGSFDYSGGTAPAQNAPADRRSYLSWRVEHKTDPSHRRRSSHIILSTGIAYLRVQFG